MGAGVSDLAAETPSGSPGLADIPESCISSIFMHLDPPEICKLALLNRTFHGASLADFVWETKLPSNYKFLVKKVLAENPENISKKEIYSRLCLPNRFDSGTKETWLDKNRGGSVFFDKFFDFGILSSCCIRFQTVAYLQQIWWFEVIGELEFEFPPGTYSLFFRLQLGKTSKRFGRRVCNLEQVHGWDIKPVRFQLSTSNGQQAFSECCLTEKGNWILCHVGDFTIENSQAPTKIKFSMMQIDCTHTKGGLCVDSVLIYPSEFRERLKEG